MLKTLSMAMRRQRREEEATQASGRVTAGIGSSLEIAVGWLPHRLERFIRGFLGGRSGERATQQRPETGEKDRTRETKREREGDRFTHVTRSFPFTCESRQSRVAEEEKEEEWKKRESWGRFGGSGGQCTVLFFLLPPGDTFFLPWSRLPLLAVVYFSFSPSSRVSSARWCYFRANVLCKCRTRVKVAIPM